MAVTFNTIQQALFLQAFFMSAGSPYYFFGSVRLCAGTQPADPSITTGVTFLSAAHTFLMSEWTAPSSGVTKLSNPINIVPNATGTASFIRIYDSTAQAVMDIPVGTSGQPCTVSTTSIINNLSMQITDLRVKFPTSVGTLLVNSRMANLLLRETFVLDDAGNAALYFGVSDLPNTGDTVDIKIYSGSQPSSADVPATGTLLATFAPASSTDIFTSPTNNTIALAAYLVQAASATGTAGYFRYTKKIAGIEYIIQGAVGTSGTDMVVASTSFVSGSDATITDFTISV